MAFDWSKYTAVDDSQSSSPSPTSTGSGFNWNSQTPISATADQIKAAQAGTAPAPGYKTQDDSQETGKVWSPVKIGGFNINPLTALRSATTPTRNDLSNQTADQISQNPAINALKVVATNPISNFVANTGAHAVSATGEGVGNLLGLGGQVASLAGKAASLGTGNQGFADLGNALATGGSEAQQAFKTLADNARQTSKTSTKEKDSAASSVTGDILGTLARIIGTSTITPNAAAALSDLTGAAGGAATEGTAGALNTVINSPISTTAQVSANTGKLPTAGDLAAGTGLDLATHGLFSGLSKYMNPSFEKQLLKNGVIEQDLPALKNLSPDNEAAFVGNLKQGLTHLEDRGPDSNVFSKAGGEVEDFIDQATQHLQNTGKQLGNAKDNLKNIDVDVMPIAAKMQPIFDKFNIKVDPSDLSLDFGKSEIKRAGPAVEQINNVWNDMLNSFKSKASTVAEGEVSNPSAQLNQNNLGVISSVGTDVGNAASTGPKISPSQMTMNGRDLEALTGQIDDITGLLKSSGYKKSGANDVLKTLKSYINNAIGEASPEFGALNSKYASLIKDLQKVQNAAKVPLGNGEVDYSGEKLMRGLLGNASDKGENAIEAMLNIEKNHGITAPKDLALKADLANIAEKFTGAEQPNSIAGIGNRAAQLPGKAGWLARGAQSIKNELGDGLTIAPQAERLIKLMTNKNAEQTVRTALPKNVGTILSNVIKAGALKAFSRNP